MIKVTEEQATSELKKDSKGRVYRELRCGRCRTLLLDEYIYSGRIKIRCHNCGTISVMVFKHKKPERSDHLNQQQGGQ